MRRPLRLVLPVAIAAWLVVAPVAADEDPAKNARLAAADGNFREADGIIERAPPEVQNDAALRLAIGEMAMRSAHGKTGEDKRPALDSARHHFAKVIELKPTEAKAATGVVQAAQELAELDMEAKHPDDAKIEAKFGIESGEKALAGGIATPEFKLMLGRMYGLRASFIKSMKEVDQLVSDSSKAAKLLAEGSVGNEQPGKLLSEASKIQMNCATRVHEGIPPSSEKQKGGDDALASAIDLATQACNLKSAADTDYATHLDALRLAHSWGLKLAWKPFMQPLVPAMPGLKLEVPRAPGWKVGAKSVDWDLVIDRNLHDSKNDGTVQVLVKQWKPGDMTLGKPWSQLNEVSSRRFEKYKEEFKEIAKSVEPAQIATGKGAPDVWHYEVEGHESKTGRMQHLGEWVFYGDKKKETIYQLKIMDWRPLPDIQDPDIVAFVASAIGEGVWPAGSTPAAPDPKKPPAPPTKKK